MDKIIKDLVEVANTHSLITLGEPFYEDMPTSIDGNYDLETWMAERTQEQIVSAVTDYLRSTV